MSFSSPANGQVPAGEWRPDWSAVVWAAVRPLLIWLGFVVPAVLAGYPGAVCITPMAWLLAVLAGVDSVRRSRSADPARRLAEAGLSGALLGLLQGLVFALVTGWQMPVPPDEMPRALVLAAVIGLGGMVACAVVALAAAVRTERAA